VWSLGVILYMLVTGRAPFQEASDSETLTMILDCKYLLPSYISSECKDLISRMIIRSPENRLKLEEIMNHDWFKDVSNDVTSQESGEDTDQSSADIKRPVKYKRSRKNDSDFVNALPLIKREHLSKEDNEKIIDSMVKGNISTKEEIVR